MTIIDQKERVECTMIAFQRGELIIEELKKFLSERKIDAGLITSGIGSLDYCKIHYITTTTLPPHDEFFTIEGPLEIASLQGSIAGGEPHLHISFFNQETGKFHIGHLEPGSRCAYRVELGIIAFPDVRTKRIIDKTTGLTDVVGEN